MLWKEARETLKPALIGLLVVGVGLAFSLTFQRALGSTGVMVDSLPLSLYTLTTALVALMIGRAQIVHENRGDRWAFLTHRPVDRSTLFWGKALAGASLYLAASGLPLLCALLWMATPGHRPMPFDSRLALPDVADLLGGLVYYAAALLIGMREARWYGSRFLPIGAAIFCSTSVLAVPDFWQAVAIIVACLVVVGTAARGTFIAGGQYEPQPRVGKAALGLGIGAGLQIAGGIVLGIATLVLSIGPRGGRELRSAKYEVTRDGSVVRTTSVLHIFNGRRNILRVDDLSGKPLDQYRDSVARAQLNAGVIATSALLLNANGRLSAAPRRHSYRGTDDLFAQLGQDRSQESVVSWFFIRRLGLIAAYDNRSAQQIGWMGPDGFTAADALPLHRFSGTLMPFSPSSYSNHQLLLAFPGEAYRLHTGDRRIRRVFTAPAGQSVIGAVSSVDTATVTADALDAISTTAAIYVQSRGGVPQLAVRRDTATAGYGSVVVLRASRAPGAPTFLHYHPENGTLTREQLERATELIDRIGDNGTVVAQYVLPDPERGLPEPTAWAEVVLTGLSTPITARLYSRVSAYLAGARRPAVGQMRTVMMVRWLLAIVASLGSALIALALARRSALERRRAQLWATFGFILGPLGVLLMLSLLDRPMRERCPACGRQRVVTRVQCEQCGAPFAPPAPDGTEIFEAALV
jgi:hypothetical protein